jgi:hypothetical protein
MNQALTCCLLLLSSAFVGASSVDPRLATLKKAYVVAVDDLGDDKPVAVCLARHLSDMTPIEATKDKDEADAIFRVKAHLPSATTRVMVGMMGGTPSADLQVDLPDGTKLWGDGAKLRRAIGKAGRLASSDADKSVECGLADELLDTLRSAMRKARDAKN